MTREIPLVGGPADGERASVPDSGVALPSIRWSGLDTSRIPDAMVGAYDGDDLLSALARSVFGTVEAVYHHLVATRHDPHPCRRGATMVAEWDAYVWEQVRDLRVDGHAMGIPPSRFRVTGAPPRIGPDVFADARPALRAIDALRTELDDIARRRSPHPSADRPRGLE